MLIAQQETTPATLLEIKSAMKIIADYAVITPVLRSDAVDKLTNAKVFFKCENLQTTGSFKIRGASYSLSCLSAEQREKGVVAFSSGNHGQAIAYAAKKLRIPATVVMPDDAPPLKINRTRALGAEVRLFNRDHEDREAIATELQNNKSLTLIPPYNSQRIIAGQGTVACEFFEQIGEMDYLFVCVGGGGLISGSSIATKGINPKCQIYGVEPETCSDAQQSLRSGQLVSLRNPFSIADGARTEKLGTETFPVIQNHVSDIVTVTENQIIDQIRFFASEMRIVVEPTGCLAAAAVLNRAVNIKPGSTVGVLITGGNVDIAKFSDWLNHEK